MRELTLKEAEETNGGNPILIAMIAARLVQMAAPHVIKFTATAAAAAAAAAASVAGYEDGYS